MRESACAETIEVCSIGLPHSEIPGSQVATHLPEAYRRYATSFIAFSSQGIHHLPLMPTIPMLTLIITKCSVMKCSAHRTRNWILFPLTRRQDGKCNERDPRDANPSRKNKKIRCKASDITPSSFRKAKSSRTNPDSTIRGITQKEPSKKCRCTIDTKKAKIFRQARDYSGGNPKIKRAAQGGRPYAQKRTGYPLCFKRLRVLLIRVLRISIVMPHFLSRGYTFLFTKEALSLLLCE